MEGQAEQSRTATPVSTSFTHQEPMSPMSHRGEGLWPEAGSAHLRSDAPQHSFDGSQPLPSSFSHARRSSQGGRGSLEGSSFKLKKARQRKLAKQLRDAVAGTATPHLSELRS